MSHSSVKRSFVRTSLLVGLGLAGLGLWQDIAATRVQAEVMPSAAHATPIAQANPVIRSGSFVSGEHPTKGSVKILNQGGKKILQLEQNFDTFNMGPDLVVILHRSNNVLATTKPPAYALKSEDYLILAPLQKFAGAQTYAIPDSVNLANYGSVAIWCRKFNATFGVAPLQ